MVVRRRFTPSRTRAWSSTIRIFMRGPHPIQSRSKPTERQASHNRPSLAWAAAIYDQFALGGSHPFSHADQSESRRPPRGGVRAVIGDLRNHRAVSRGRDLDPNAVWASMTNGVAQTFLHNPVEGFSHAERQEIIRGQTQLELNGRVPCPPEGDEFGDRRDQTKARTPWPTKSAALGSQQTSQTKGRSSILSRRSRPSMARSIFSASMPVSR